MDGTPDSSDRGGRADLGRRARPPGSEMRRRSCGPSTAGGQSTRSEALPFRGLIRPSKPGGSSARKPRISTASCRSRVRSSSWPPCPPTAGRRISACRRGLALARLGAAGLAASAGPGDGRGHHGRQAGARLLSAGARRLGVDIRDCIVFEDAPAGIQAGVAAGAAVVVIGAGSRNRRTGRSEATANWEFETVPAGLRLVRRVVSTLAAELGTAGPRH